MALERRKHIQKSHINGKHLWFKKIQEGKNAAGCDCAGEHVWKAVQKIENGGILLFGLGFVYTCGIPYIPKFPTYGNLKGKLP